MIDPFALLGIAPTTDTEEVRRAYHQQARLCHPDQFQDEKRREEAQHRMVALNEAYQEALKLAASGSSMPYTNMLSLEDALALSRRMLKQQNPESALRQLLRSVTRNAEWFFLQGEILMQMEQYESAEQSFREAIRYDPQNIEYRRGALDANVAARKAHTVTGRIRKLLRNRGLRVLP